MQNHLYKYEDIFSFYLDQRGVNIKGKSYDANIISDYESNTEEDCTVTVYKKYLSLFGEKYQTSANEYIESKWKKILA